MRIDAEQAQHSIGADGQQPDDRCKDHGNHTNHAAGKGGDLFRILQGDPFGRQFTQNDHEVAENERDQNHADIVQRIQRDERPASIMQRLRHHGRKAVGCKGAGQKTAQGNTNLNGRKKFCGGLYHFQQLYGLCVSAFGLLFDFVFIERNDSRFRCGKECIDQNQNQLQQQLTAYGVAVQRNSSLTCAAKAA